MINTQIEISSPREAVRAILLDFPYLPQWSHGFIKSVAVTSRAQPDLILAGDRLHCEIGGMSFCPTVLVSLHEATCLTSLATI
jgi:hypothetical protein